MSDEFSNIKVVGRGVADLDIPKRIRLLRLFFALTSATFLAVAIFALIGWGWVEHGISTTSAALAAATVTFSLFVGFVFSRSKPLLLALKLKKNSEGKLRFSGFRDSSETLKAGLILALPAAGLIFSGAFALKRCPIARELRQVNIQSASPQIEGLIPVYFWDYSTWIDSNWLMTQEILIPYEKGPPEKLLSKIIFRDRQTKEVTLELNGRRPRMYSESAIAALFQKPAPAVSDFPLLFQLEKEAGLLTKTGVPTVRRPDEFFHFRFVSGTRLFGVPWADLLSGSDKSNAGRFFFLGPDGSVFQVRCVEPCRAGDFLSRVLFPGDPRGSFAERKNFSAERIQKMIKQMALPKTPQEKELFERNLELLLISYLTLDPSQSEAFFHLGKLTSSKDTLLSILRYARDVGMEPAKVSELESVANSRSM